MFLYDINVWYNMKSKSMFRERKLFRKIIPSNSVISLFVYLLFLIPQVMPIKVLRKIAKEIIYADYDGYNGNCKDIEMCYLDSLSRW